LKWWEFGDGRCYSIRREGRVWGWLWLEHCPCLLCSCSLRELELELAELCRCLREAISLEVCSVRCRETLRLASLSLLAETFFPRLSRATPGNGASNRGKQPAPIEAKRILCSSKVFVSVVPRCREEKSR
jgi:hypothetical protein